MRHLYLNSFYCQIISVTGVTLFFAIYILLIAVNRQSCSTTLLDNPADANSLDEKTDANSLENFIQELNDMNIYDQLLKPIDSSPHENYDIFMKLIQDAKNLHFPKKTVKFNKKEAQKI